MLPVPGSYRWARAPSPSPTRDTYRPKAPHDVPCSTGCTPPPHPQPLAHITSRSALTPACGWQSQ
eukprot:5248767-Prymnesium_polylepis.1